MPKIEANTGVVPHINVFTVAPDKQQALVAWLTESGAPGQRPSIPSMALK